MLKCPWLCPSPLHVSTGKEIEIIIIIIIIIISLLYFVFIRGRSFETVRILNSLLKYYGRPIPVT
jgi:hypothetical protein